MSSMQDPGSGAEMLQLLQPRPFLSWHIREEMWVVDERENANESLKE